VFNLKPGFPAFAPTVFLTKEPPSSALIPLYTLFAVENVLVPTETPAFRPLFDLFASIQSLRSLKRKALPQLLDLSALFQSHR
jgi:hypothetical protein